MPPITWRNIGTTVSPGSARSLTAGTTGVQSALASLGDIIKQQQEMAVANAGVQREANTQNYLDQVASADLSQLQDPDFVAGLAGQRDAMGMRLDRAATRDAILNRRQALQKDTVAQQAFADQQAEVDQRGIVDELRTLAAQGRGRDVDAILAERQLINEGEIRKELAGVQDNLMQRQYREAGEQRAQAAADRAAEAHQLSMTAGRENLAYQRDLRQDAARERNDNKLADSAVMEITNQFRESRETANALLRDIGKEQGLPTDDTGLPDVSRMDPDQEASYREAVQSSGLSANLSATNEKQALVKTLRESGASPSAIQRATKQLDIMQGMDALAPEDAVKAENQVTAVNAELDRIQKQMTRNYETEVARNPFIEPSKTPLEDVTKTVEKLGKAGMPESERRLVADTLVEWSTNGMTIDGGQKIVVPSQLIAAAAASTDADSWIRNDAKSYLKNLQSLLGNKGMEQMAKDADSVRSDFLKEMTKLENDKLGNAYRVINSAKAKKGVSINPNDTVDRLLKRNF
ncbi:lytic tail fiber protein [Pseudomonas phage Ka3]|nr:lytic tail fiber protein [Pseudomonas phage Ka3]